LKNASSRDQAFGSAAGGNSFLVINLIISNSFKIGRRTINIQWNLFICDLNEIRLIG
jgi:hypothetical protein